MRYRRTWVFAALAVALLAPALRAADVPKPPAPAKAEAKPQSATRRFQVGGASFIVFKTVEQKAYDAALTLTPKAPDARLEKADLLIAARDADNAYRLRYEKGRLSLLLRLAGVETALASAEVPSPPPGEGLRFTVRRRRSWIAARVDGREVLRVADPSFTAGGFGIAENAQPVRLGKWSLHPFAPLDIQDDFMRTDEDKNPWQSLSGSWRLHTVRESETVHPARGSRAVEPSRSANYFSYEGRTPTADKAALCAIGEPAWSDCSAGASVRSGGGWVGVTVGVRDARNYTVLRWRLDTLRPRPSPVEIVRVENGKARVLGRALAPGAVSQWYRLSLDTFGDRLIGRLDGTVVMDLTVAGCGEGKVGLYAAGPQGALFDDIGVRSLDALHFDTAESLATAERSGPWKLLREHGPVPLPHETRRVGWSRSAEEPAVARLARTGWRRCALQADVALPASGSRVVLSLDEARRGLALECRRLGPGKGEAALTLTEGGARRRLAQCALDLPDQASVEFRLEATAERDARAFADGRLLFRVDAALNGPGRPAIRIDGPGVIRVSNAQVRFRSEQDASRKVTQAFFAHDPYMVGWAGETGAWVRPKEKDGVYWHKSDFHGPFRVKFAPDAGLTLYLKARGRAPESGYVARVATSGDALKLSLLRSGNTIAESAVPKDAKLLELAWEAGELGARCDGRRLFALRDPDPPAGCRLALRAPAKSLGKVEVTQFNVKDYIFTKAPADWTTSGLWEITNRFACDPRWSWLSATCWDGVAAGWNKHEFSGDMTVEFYAGMRMQRNRRRSYPRPGEINATLCGDGRDLNTGYSVIINGWDPEWSGQWSRILRGDREVACARRELVPCNRLSNPSRRAIPVPWDPGGRPIHGAWYYVKIRKLGGRVEVYFDNVLVMAYDDPEPLAGRRVAVWTMDNSIVIARVRVSYAHCRQAPVPVTAEEKTPDAASTAAAESRPLVRSTTHPGATCSFENGLDGWVNPDGDQGAELSLEAVRHGGRCMRLANIASGGTLGARLAVPDLDLLRATRLSFRYCASPGARVNLYFPVRTGECFVQLTGPGDENANLKRLGGIADARADGRWRTAVFDLARAARKAFPEDTRLPCREVRLGFYHPGYGRAGIRGNGQDASLLVDDFRIGSLGEPHAVFELAAPGGPGRATLSGPEYAFTVTDNKPADPPKDANGRDTVLAVDCPRPGLHYLNVRTRASSDAAWSGAMHYPFWVDKAPLRLRSVTPDPKARDGAWGGEPFEVAFEPYVDGALDFHGAALTVNDVRVWGRAPALRMDWDRRTLTMDLTRSTFTFKDGQKVRLGLILGKRFCDRQTFAWPLRYRRDLDKVPPAPPVIGDVPLDLDFSGGVGGAAATSTAFTSLTPTPESGLRISNLVLGGNFSTRLFNGAVHVGRNPLLVFDYRFPPLVSVDWLVTLGSQSQPLKFTDVSPNKPRYGFVPGVVADNRWRHAEVNLRRFAEAVPAKRRQYNMSGLYIADGGYSANAPGASFELARVRLVPLRSAAKGFDVQWTASDISGIAGYSYAWSAKPDGVPEPKIMTREGRARFEGLPEGRLYLHVRAVDKAGNWSETRSRAFLMDNTPPAYVTAAEARPADEVLKVRYRDRLAGVDASTILCRLDEPAQTAERVHVKYDYARNVYAWRWVEQAPARMGAVPDGAERLFHVSSCLDFAGNASAPRVFRMTIRHKADRTPPCAPVVRLLDHKMLSRRTYETGASLAPWGHRSYSLLERVDRDRGDRCLRVRAVNHRRFGVYLHGPEAKAYDLDAYPWLCFDYRIPQKTRLALLINVSGRRFAVDLSGGPRPGYRRLKPRAFRAKADGQWRHAALNLGELVRDQGGMRPGPLMRWLAIAREGNARKGQEFWLDNVTILGPLRRLPGVRAKARDLTGIRGFVCAVTKRPDAEPDKPEMPTDRWRLTDAPAGLSYIHVRARDGAGNLGRTAHVPLVYEPAPPTPAGDATRP